LDHGPRYPTAECKVQSLTPSARSLARLNRTDDGRELATEFMQRHRMAERECFVPRVIRDMRPEVRAAWLAASSKQQRAQQQRAERRSV